jgi:hypothetical protein
MITGRCECATVAYEVDGEINDFSHCHCSQCRRLHGAAFGTYGGVDKAQFRWKAGEDNLRVYASSEKNDRHFCNTCGSLIMTTIKSEPDAFYVTMGTMDGDPPRPPGYHIYVGSKADWYEVCDDLPQFDEYPEDDEQ